jgi:predicted nucleic acid-binding protein
MTARIALDTSVVVAGLLAQHPRHAASAEWLRRGERGEVELAMATHGIAESFATLTARAPGLSVPPEHAVVLLRSVLRFVQPVEVDAPAYGAVIEQVAAAGLASGVVYDGLHVAAAERWGAERLLTLNLRDFYRLCTTPGFVLSPEAALQGT